MTAVFLDPARFGWLDRLPAPRMPRWRRRGQRHADALTHRPAPDPGWAGPKHAVSDQRPNKQPWLTAAQPVLPPETAPETDRYPAEEFLDLPVVPGFMRGDYGVRSVADVLAQETPFPYDPAYDNCAGSPGCGDERVFFKWYGEQIACPRCYVNVFGGEPDARLVRRLPAHVLEAERLAKGLIV